jgi:hypothetical protein
MTKPVQWLFDACVHFNPVNGRTHIVAYSHDGRCVSKEFEPTATMADFETWAQSPDTWAGIEPVARAQDSTINYSHETGKITLVTHRQDRSFDPNNDEDLARLVRQLKRIASMPVETKQREIPNLLPEPTPEELAARTIYKNVGVPDGVRRGRTPKARYQRPAVSAAETLKLANKALEDLLDAL